MDPTTIDLSPHVVVTVHTPAGDVPIVADPTQPGGGSVHLLGVDMPYDVQVVFGPTAPTNAPGTLLGNIDQYSPYLLLGAVVVGALLLARRL
jgi:hypothetical protein